MEPIFTVGHSTRSTAELLELLTAQEVELLVDVRRHPGSRRHPHFNRDALRASLLDTGIDYRHLEELGGRRGEPDPASPNTAWESAGFRAYADHLVSPGAREAIGELLEEARTRSPCLLCAEAVPWRCHRQLLADVLVLHGARVLHILDEARAQDHNPNPAAKLREDGTVIYPAGSDPQGELFED